MTWLLIGIAAALLLGVAAIAVWHAFNDPAFYARAVKAVAGVLLSAILNGKKKTPKEIADEIEYNKTGVKPDRTDDTPKRGNWNQGSKP